MYLQISFMILFFITFIIISFLIFSIVSAAKGIAHTEI